MLRTLNRGMEIVAQPTGSGAFAISASAGWHVVTGYPGQFQTFASTSSVTTGDTFFYGAYDAAGNTECGLGTYGSGSLARTVILESTNSNLACSFSGSVTVFCGVPDVWFLPGYSVAAAGTTQGTGTVLSQRVSVVTSASAGQGVVLNLYLPEQIIVNSTAVELYFYPPIGASAQINALGVNTPAQIYPGNGVTVRQVTSILYRTM
jgi:hypothetical protein